MKATGVAAFIVCAVLSAAAFAADTRALNIHVAENVGGAIRTTVLRIAPNGSGSLAAGGLLSCSQTPPGVFDFDGLYMQFKARASSRQRNPQDTAFTFDNATGAVHYIDDRRMIDELVGKARMTAVASSTTQGCRAVEAR